MNGMTWDRWQSLSQAEKEKQRDNSDLSPQLIGLEGWRVEVTGGWREKPYRFIVGKSTGWKPIHLEIPTRRSSGGMGACKAYASVVKLYKAR